VLLEIGQLEAAAIESPRALTLVEGPAGSGKTTMLATAIDALHQQGVPVFGCPASAAATQEPVVPTNLQTDTLAKLLLEHTVRDGGSSAPFVLPAGAKIIVDEAGSGAHTSLKPISTVTRPTPGAMQRR
jgi:AAA domain